MRPVATASSSSVVGSATRTVLVVAVFAGPVTPSSATGAALRVTSRVAHPHPVPSSSVAVTSPAKVMRSPGNTESRMRNVMRPSRPFGPVQSVTNRSIQAAWFGVFKKMSLVPLRFTAKSLSWCMGRQSRLASAPSTTVVALTSYESGGIRSPTATSPRSSDGTPAPRSRSGGSCVAGRVPAPPGASDSRAVPGSPVEPALT